MSLSRALGGLVAKWRSRYNSVLFLTTQGVRAQVLPVSEDFLSSSFNGTDYYDLGNCNSDLTRTVALANEFRTRIQSGAFERLDIETCRKAYAQQYVSRRGDLIVVQEGPKLSNNGMACSFEDRWDPAAEDHEVDWSTIFVPFTIDPHTVPSYSWQCPYSDNIYSCNATTLSRSIGSGHSWDPFGSPVRYCWSEPLMEECTLTFNTAIGFAVIACNLAKVSCMCLTLVLVKSSTLMTLGDAIQSFLTEPDHHTMGMSIRTAKQINLIWEQERIALAWLPFKGIVERQKAAMSPVSRVWIPKSRRWWRSATPSRFLCFTL